MATGSNGFSSSTWAGVSRCGSRNSFLVHRVPAPSAVRRSLRRQAGGDVFGALDFVRVPFFEQVLGAALFAHHVGAGLDGVAVGFLLGLAQSRPWGGNAFRGAAAKNFYCS